MRILVVEDDAGLCEQLYRSLQGQRYDVDTAGDGQQALDKIFDQDYDLIILDIMLPAMDGFQVLQEIRTAEIKTPVIILTARGAVDDRIKGLDGGADDYLAKPFSLAELMARIRAMLRRTSDHANAALTSGRVILNTVSREVFFNGRLLDLTNKEFSIFEFLLYNKNQVVSRFNMAEHVWGDAYDPFAMSNFIDVHIKNLRAKLKAVGCLDVIKTVRGIGFTIQDQDR